MFNNELVTLRQHNSNFFSELLYWLLVKTNIVKVDKSKKTTYYSINNYLRGKAKKVQKNGLETWGRNYIDRGATEKDEGRKERSA